MAGAIVLSELSDYEDLTSTQVSRPPIAVVCVGVFLALIAVFGAYGGYNEIKDCLIVVQ